MVVNIFGLVFTQSGGGTSTWAWLYTEQGGDVYIQENASYRSAFEGFLSGIPALSGVAAAVANGHGGVVPINSSDGQAILNNWRAQAGKKAGSCFKAPLNPANA
jgi:histidinol phosphatase-like PHP family hydrolase